MLLVAPLALAAAPRAAAQDTHYWAIQYGPVGQLVGGQLIGGSTDLSATFYNPGSLSLRNESSYLLSTESVQWETLSTAPQVIAWARLGGPLVPPVRPDADRPWAPHVPARLVSIPMQLAMLASAALAFVSAAGRI